MGSARPPISPSCPADDGDQIAVRRADLVTALDEVRVAYENAVAAANADLLDFEPFDGLPAAIAILRRALVEEAPR